MSRRPPSERSEYSVFWPITTRWEDNDQYGHVNNVAYYSWFDTAVNAWLVAQGLLDPANGDQIGLVVESSCRYFRPLSFPQRVQIGIRTGRIGTSSIVWKLGAFTFDDPRAAAEGRFIHVYVDRERRRPISISATWRQALTPFS
ncbi:acyl-CoA thioesterase [Sphingomonas sp. MAH-20]|uniref:Acyl-CoA thioesterase n=1 Tax=Sphingomonas horti TaxID=2682842 RepID=A0A6I4J2A0_9SPHN|nr:MULTISPECIES: thioesterase family protein [Sphingomonas]MBA2920587.1 acyl-CoA thioesterase [Sphingomonas sp. CGMCC 1.13658]MVO78178.1 acyl-CoA thioesterase [Sphingomonas horti]